MTRRISRLPELDLIGDLVKRITRLERATDGVVNAAGNFDPTVFGDIISKDWDGNGITTLDLSTAADATATKGFAFDSSAGAAQFEGNVYVGGVITVGSNVQIDTTDGLTIDGGIAKAIDIQMDSTRWTTHALSGTMESQATVSFTIPSWVNTLYVMAHQWIQLPGDADAGYSELACRINIDGSNGFVVTHGVAPDGTNTLNEPTMLVAHTRLETTTTWSNPIDIVQQAHRYAGPMENTQTATHGELSVMVMGQR